MRVTFEDPQGYGVARTASRDEQVVFADEREVGWLERDADGWFFHEYEDAPYLRGRALADPNKNLGHLRAAKTWVRERIRSMRSNPDDDPLYARTVDPLPPEPTRRARHFTIFVYDRHARGVVSKAFRKAGFITLGKWLKRKNQDVPYYEYWSQEAIWDETGGQKSLATPRYGGEATDEEMEELIRISERIDLNAALEVYHD